MEAGLRFAGSDDLSRVVGAVLKPNRFFLREWSRHDSRLRELIRRGARPDVVILSTSDLPSALDEEALRAAAPRVGTVENLFVPGEGVVIDALAEAERLAALRPRLIVLSVSIMEFYKPYSLDHRARFFVSPSSAGLYWSLPSKAAPARRRAVIADGLAGHFLLLWRYRNIPNILLLGERPALDWAEPESPVASGAHTVYALGALAAFLNRMREAGVEVLVVDMPRRPERPIDPSTKRAHARALAALGRAVGARIILRDAVPLADRDMRDETHAAPDPGLRRRFTRDFFLPLLAARASGTGR